jgi:hypothetical protein
VHICGRDAEPLAIELRGIAQRDFGDGKMA